MNKTTMRSEIETLAARLTSPDLYSDPSVLPHRDVAEELRAIVARHCMPIERAKEIVGRCIQHAMYEMGISEGPPQSLADVAMHELLEANELLEGHREKTETGERIFMHCDPRMTAALYVAYHFPIDPSDAVAVSADNRAVVVVEIRRDASNDEDDE